MKMDSNPWINQVINRDRSQWISDTFEGVAIDPPVRDFWDWSMGVIEVITRYRLHSLCDGNGAPVLYILPGIAEHKDLGIAEITAKPSSRMMQGIAIEEDFRVDDSAANGKSAIGIDELTVAHLDSSIVGVCVFREVSQPTSHDSGR